MIDGKAGGCNRSDGDRKSTRLNSRHGYISYAVFCLKKKKNHNTGFPCAVHLFRPSKIITHVAVYDLAYDVSPLVNTVIVPYSTQPFTFVHQRFEHS